MTTPHKHATILVAIAEGREVEFLSTIECKWIAYRERYRSPLDSDFVAEWRIKPEVKPDVVVYGTPRLERVTEWLQNYHTTHNLKLTFDGETGKLKSAEVLK